MAQTMDQWYAETGRQSELDAIRRNPGGYEQAVAKYNSGGYGQSGNTQMSQNPVDIAKQMYELANQFRQPAISTLQAQQPGITSAYQGLSTAAAGQKPTIEQRYKDTLAEITKTTRGAAAGEFTQRGIPLSSNLVEQTVGSRLAPQIASAATQRDTNLLGVDQLLADIGMGQQTSQTSLAQAIAAIQAGASGEAISSAQNIYGQQEQSRQQQLTNALRQQEIDISKQGKTESPYLALSEGQTLYNLLTGQAQYTAPKSYKPSDSLGNDPLGLNS